MRYVIVWTILVLAGLSAGCADVTGPHPNLGDASIFAELARRPAPFPPPDSVGIPTPPVPPIYEEVPLIFEPGQ